MSRRSRTGKVLVVELAAPETGAPRYSGRDRLDLELRLEDSGLLNASLTKGELVVLVQAAENAEPRSVAAACATALERRPTNVQVRGLGSIARLR